MFTKKNWLLGLVGAFLFMGICMTCGLRAEAADQDFELGIEMRAACDTSLYSNPDCRDATRIDVPKNGVYVTIENAKNYTLVEYEGVRGYIYEEYMKYMPGYLEAKEAEAAAAKAAEEARIAAEKAKQEAIEAAATEKAKAEIEMYGRELTEEEHEDIRLLAALIHSEAGNQPYEGQVAVGAVVMNRLKAGYADTLEGVIYQKGQFTPVRSGKVDARLETGNISESCQNAAMEAFSGTDNVDGALHFRRAGSKEGQIIGNHVFY